MERRRRRIEHLIRKVAARQAAEEADYRERGAQWNERPQFPGGEPCRTALAREIRTEPNRRYCTSHKLSKRGATVCHWT